jgi:hypothetical protein
MTTEPTDGIAPSERRELRSIVKAQFKVLRTEVRRRKEELGAEVEHELLERHREEDRAIAAARAEVDKVCMDAAHEVRRIGEELAERFADLSVRTSAGATFNGFTIRFEATNPNRTQVHRAATAAIPATIADALLHLDQQEITLLRQLSAGALTSEQAQQFMGGIPTVGQLVPRARVAELAGQIDELEAGDE